MSNGVEAENTQAARAGEWAVLESYFPGQNVDSIGVIVLDIGRNQLYLKLRPQWWQSGSDGAEAEIWEALGDDLTEKAKEIGAAELLEWLQDTASHVIRIGPRQPIKLFDALLCIDNLYDQHVGDLRADYRSIVESTAWRHVRRGAAKNTRSKVPLTRSSLRRLVASGSAGAGLFLVFFIAVVLATRHSHQEGQSTQMAQLERFKAVKIVPLPVLSYESIVLNLDMELLHPHGIQHRKKRLHGPPSHLQMLHISSAVNVRPRLVFDKWIEPPLIKTPDELYPASFLTCTLPEPLNTSGVVILNIFFLRRLMPRTGYLVVDVKCPSKNESNWMWGRPEDA